MSDIGNLYGSYESAQEYEREGNLIMSAVEYWMCVQYYEHGEYPFMYDISVGEKASAKLEKLLYRLPYAPLSKTTFIKGCQCKKMLWLYKNKYNERCVTAEQQKKYDRGHSIGLLAQALFKGGWDASVFTYQYALKSLQRRTPLQIPPPPYKIKQNLWIERTRYFMNDNVPFIYEAAFAYDGIFAAVDILSKDGNAVTLYEVKSSFEVKDVHLHDCALQYYVLSKNLNIKDFFIVTLNEGYINTLGIDIDELTEENCNVEKLFVLKSVLGSIQNLQATVQKEVEEVRNILALKKEPVISVDEHCHIPYECEFLKYCNR